MKNLNDRLERTRKDPNPPRTSCEQKAMKITPSGLRFAGRTALSLYGTREGLSQVGIV